MCKQAIAAQINSMAATNGQRKLGLVAFDHNVEIIGDGVEKSMTIDQNMLNDYNQLLATGEQQAGIRMKKPIAETKDSLLQKVGQMHVNGTTALGPAVLTSVAMASKGAPGSQVIVCTDGMANVGLGSFRGFGGYGGGEDSLAFYDQVGLLAEQNGVMVNLITIQGAEANIQGLSRMIELSGG